MAAKKKASSPKPTSTGLPLVDGLSVKSAPVLQDYLDAVSQYILESGQISKGSAKSAQIALSAGLGRALKTELETRLPGLSAHAGELTVAGALRSARADVSESHSLDGLRLAIEIKPINLAVGRAIWNRFGDVRAFAVNIHLKFPFAVVAGVLAVPTWEWRNPGRAVHEVEEENLLLETPEASELLNLDEPPGEPTVLTDNPDRIDTTPLIGRLVSRLQRTRLRGSEADAAHLLEGVCVIVYDPSSGELEPTLPPQGSGLRWEEFLDRLADLYNLRFE